MTESTAPSKLLTAIAKITAEQAATPLAQRQGMCLHYTRIGLAEAGVTIPQTATAYECYQAIAADPAKYGLKSVAIVGGKPSVTPCIEFWKPPVGHQYGHIGIVNGGEIYSAVNYRLAGEFVEPANVAGAFVLA